MEMSASRNENLSAGGWLGLTLLLLGGLALVGLVAQRLGALPISLGAGSAGGVTVSAAGMSFGADTITLSAGGPLTLVLANDEVLPHSFDVDALGIHLAMPPSRSLAATIDGLPAGVYTFYCGVPGHRAAGMEGTLIVAE